MALRLCPKLSSPQHCFEAKLRLNSINLAVACMVFGEADFAQSGCWSGCGVLVLSFSRTVAQTLMDVLSILPLGDCSVKESSVL